MKLKKLKIDLPEVKKGKDWVYPQVAGQLPSKPLTAMFLGPRGCGKSHAVNQMIQLYMNCNFYQKMYAVSPTLKSDSTQKLLFQEAERRGIPVVYYDEFNPEVFREIFEEIKADLTLWKRFQKVKKIQRKIEKIGIDNIEDDILIYLMQHYPDFNGDLSDILETYPDYIKNAGDNAPIRSLINLDDCFGSELFRSSMNKKNSAFIKFLISHRHYHCSIHFLCQSLSYFSKTIKNNTMLWCIWSVKSEKETNYIAEEVANVFGNKKNFIKFSKYVSKMPFKFIMVDNMNQSIPELRIGFDLQIPVNDIDNLTNDIEIDEEN
jgi:hypothetical protein